VGTRPFVLPGLAREQGGLVPQQEPLQFSADRPGFAAANDLPFEPGDGSGAAHGVEGNQFPGSGDVLAGNAERGFDGDGAALPGHRQGDAGNAAEFGAWSAPPTVGVDHHEAGANPLNQVSAGIKEQDLIVAGLGSEVPGAFDLRVIGELGPGVLPWARVWERGDPRPPTEGFGIKGAGFAHKNKPARRIRADLDPNDPRTLAEFGLAENLKGLADLLGLRRGQAQGLGVGEKPLAVGAMKTRTAVFHPGGGVATRRRQKFVRLWDFRPCPQGAGNPDVPGP